MVAFEAAVARRHPDHQGAARGLTANRIEWIAGIINGTSQLHPVRDARDGRAFDAVLEARRRRAATPRRIRPSTSRASTPRTSSTIMSAIAFGIPMQFDKAYTEGISKLTREDIRYAEELGYRIKLLGITRRATASGIELRVHPTLDARSSV